MNKSCQIALSFATEDQALVETVYHYLKAKQISVFFAPSPEGQLFLSGKNQREAFFDIFALQSEYVALFVSKNYITREVPMEEARIAFAEHGEDGRVIPVYLDGTPLPKELLDPKKINYFESKDPSLIAKHLSEKVQSTLPYFAASLTCANPPASDGSMVISGNSAEKQVFIHTLQGSIKL